MPKAGYCAECGANVWLLDDGTCVRGHSATSISQHYEAASQADAALKPAHATRPNPKRRPLVIGGSVIAVMVVIALCGLGAAALRPLASKGTAAAGEWDGRLSKDYPGWKKVGFNVRSFSGSAGSETTYAFALVPPGRDFPVSIEYKSSGDAAPISQDEVFISGGDFTDRSTSLLDYIDANYVQKGRAVTSVTSDTSGNAVVTWRKVRRILFFTSTTGSFDELDYDEDTQAWSVSFSPSY